MKIFEDWENDWLEWSSTSQAGMVVVLIVGLLAVRDRMIFEQRYPEATNGGQVWVDAEEYSKICRGGSCWSNPYWVPDPRLTPEYFNLQQKLTFMLAFFVFSVPKLKKGVLTS